MKIFLSIISLLLLLVSCGTKEENELTKQTIEQTIEQTVETELSIFGGMCKISVEHAIDVEGAFSGYSYTNSETKKGGIFSDDLIKKVNTGFVYNNLEKKSVYYSFLENKIIGTFDEYLINRSVNNQLFFINKIDEENDEITVIHNDEIVLKIPYPGVFDEKIVNELQYPYSPQLNSFFIGENNFTVVYNNTDMAKDMGSSYILYKNFELIGKASQFYKYDDENVIAYIDSRWENIQGDFDKIANDLNELGIDGNLLKIHKNGENYTAYGNERFENVDERQHWVVYNGEKIAEFGDMFEYARNSLTNEVDVVKSEHSNFIEGSKMVLLSDDGKSFAYVKYDEFESIVVKDGVEIIRGRAIYDIGYAPGTHDLYVINDDDSTDDPEYKDSSVIKRNAQIYKNSEKIDLLSELGEVAFDENGDFFDDKNKYERYKGLEEETIKYFQEKGYILTSNNNDFTCNEERSSCSFIYYGGGKYEVFKDFVKQYEGNFDENLYTKLHEEHKERLENDQSTYDYLVYQELDDLINFKYLKDNLILESTVGAKKEVFINTHKGEKLFESYDMYYDMEDTLHVIESVQGEGIRDYVCNI